MTSKHTPGPWRVESDTDITARSGEFVATAHDPRSEVGTAREYANARLIAAAPDLLDALRSLVDCPDYRGIQTYEMRAAREAIRKATSP